MNNNFSIKGWRWKQLLKEDVDISQYDNLVKSIESNLNQELKKLNAGYFAVNAGVRYSGDTYGEIQFREKKDLPEDVFNQILEILEKLGLTYVSSSLDFEMESGERSYYPRVQFEFDLNESKGYSKYLVDKDNPKGETEKFDTKTMNQILKKIVTQLKDKHIVKEVIQSVLEKKKRDRCLRIADRKFKKPSAYKSGAVVRCRKGNIWKGLKEETESLTEKQKETLRTWFKRKGAPGSTGGWVDCNAPIYKDGKKVGYKPCGRKKGEKRAKYPSCRPTAAKCKDPGKGKSWGKTK